MPGTPWIPAFSGMTVGVRREFAIALGGGVRRGIREQTGWWRWILDSSLRFGMTGRGFGMPPFDGAQGTPSTSSGRAFHGWFVL